MKGPKLLQYVGIVRYRISEYISYVETCCFKIEEEDIPPKFAPFQVFQEIEYYNRNDRVKKKRMMREILTRQNSAINSFMKLQISGITEDQILNLYKTIDDSQPCNHAHEFMNP